MYTIGERPTSQLHLTHVTTTQQCRRTAPLWTWRDIGETSFDPDVSSPKAIIVYAGASKIAETAAGGQPVYKCISI